MKHTIKVDAGMSFVVENRATDVSVGVVTALFSKHISMSHERAGALAAALVISAEAVERSTAGVDIQRLVNKTEGLAR